MTLVFSYKGKLGMKKVLISLMVALTPVMAFAQGASDISTTLPLGNGQFLSSRSADGFSENKILGSDSSNNTIINAPSGATAKISVANTPVASVSSTGITMAAGQNINLPVYVPTFAATPVAATNMIKKGYNAIPTAAANTAACLPAVPVAGDTFEGFNSMANTVRVKACGTPGINGAAAGTYFPVATMNFFRCVAKSATAYECGTLAVPTPAGP